MHIIVTVPWKVLPSLKDFSLNMELKCLRISKRLLFVTDAMLKLKSEEKKRVGCEQIIQMELTRCRAIFLPHLKDNDLKIANYQNQSTQNQ